MLLHHLADLHPDEVRPYLTRMATEKIATVAAEAYKVIEEGETRKARHDRLCWVSQKRAEKRSCIRRLKARETPERLRICSW